MVKFPTVLVSWGKRCLVWVPSNSFTYPGLYFATCDPVYKTTLSDKGPDEIISCKYRLVPWFGQRCSGTYEVK